MLNGRLRLSADLPYRFRDDGGIAPDAFDLLDDEPLDFAGGNRWRGTLGPAALLRCSTDAAAIAAIPLDGIGVGHRATARTATQDATQQRAMLVAYGSAIRAKSSRLRLSRSTFHTATQSILPASISANKRLLPRLGDAVLHQLPDGTLVATTYAIYRQQDIGTSIISLRFAMNEIDAIMKEWPT